MCTPNILVVIIVSYFKNLLFNMKLTGITLLIYLILNPMSQICDCIFYASICYIYIPYTHIASLTLPTKSICEWCDLMSSIWHYFDSFHKMPCICRGSNQNRISSKARKRSTFMFFTFSLPFAYVFALIYLKICLELWAIYLYDFIEEEYLLMTNMILIYLFQFGLKQSVRLYMCQS